MIQGNLALSPRLNSGLKAANTGRGMIIALTILGLWAISSGVFLFGLDLTQLSPVWILPLILWQTFLQTGLFITGHDAMHGVVFPGNRQVNDFVGRVAVMAYGLFSYSKLLDKHWQHHRHPASTLDPDFHPPKSQNFFAWYFQFMRRYWGWSQTIGILTLLPLVVLILQVPVGNLLLFEVVPAVFSSLQLFYFGTYLPHREPAGGYQNSHRAQSIPFPVLGSFLACYHFGYHEEHHQFPQLAWWQLPKAFNTRTRVISSATKS